MALFKVNVDLLIAVDDEDELSDAVAEALRPILRKFSDLPSCVIDWRYAPGGWGMPDDGATFEYGEDD